MRLSPLDYVRLARGLPPGEVLRKASALAGRRLRGISMRWRDRLRSTYPPDAEIPSEPLQSLLAPARLKIDSQWSEALQLAAQEARAHRFDLLGSGPVVPCYGASPHGMEGHSYPQTRGFSAPPLVNGANRAVSNRLRRLVSPACAPIDWQADFKSGYRWSETTWYRDTPYADRTGVDVKVPWELARCQHLPAMVLSLHLNPGDAANAAALQCEFQDQILDFMAANPPRFGVNWCCTMDVAIRAANWVLAHELLQAHGCAAAPAFDHEFKRALLAHGRHIVDNLEWSTGLRSNHYLSNMCGLLFVAAHMPSTPETDAWLALAVPELVRESELQFQSDGSNFEGSTSYHRLSAEMVVFTLALLRAVPRECLDRALKKGLQDLRFRGPGPDPRGFVRALDGAAAVPWEQLAAKASGMRTFTQAVTRPDGTVVQVGDNDSGRFFRFTPTGAPDGEPRSMPGDHSHLVRAIDALLGDHPSAGSPDEAVISAWLGDAALRAPAANAAAAGRSPLAFPDFGLHVYRGPRIWFAVRCGSVGQRGNGGHAHNDQLSLELCVDGVAFLVDPGTYLYTPLPKRRNQMRSTGAHNTIVVAGLEQNGWLRGAVGLFSLTRKATARVLEATATHWVGEHDGFGKPCRRTVHWRDVGIEVQDRFDGAFALNLQLAPGTSVELESARTVRLSLRGRSVRLAFDGGRCSVEDGVYSAAYGLIEPAPRLRVHELSGSVSWTATPLDPVWEAA